MSLTSHRDERVDVLTVVDGYTDLIRQRVDAGWSSYLTTLMYRPLPGDRRVVLDQMLDEAGRVYSTFLTRAVRRPLSSRCARSLPILIVAPDAPVGKSSKPLRDVVINDGLHLHGVLVVPPIFRLRVPVEEHFRTMQALYVRDRSCLDCVHVVSIESSVDRAVEYALKSVARRRWSLDEVLVLPRTIKEVRGAR